jgi:hypothetical protein
MHHPSVWLLMHCLSATHMSPIIREMSRERGWTRDARPCPGGTIEVPLTPVFVLFCRTTLIGAGGVLLAFSVTLYSLIQVGLAGKEA